MRCSTALPSSLRGRADGSQVRATVSTVFGDPFEGRTSAVIVFGSSATFTPCSLSLATVPSRSSPTGGTCAQPSSVASASTYPLDAVNDAIQDLNTGNFQGRGILIPEGASS